MLTWDQTGIVPVRYTLTLYYHYIKVDKKISKIFN